MLLLTVGSVLIATGLGTPHWAGYDPDSDAHVGLWQVCVSEKCVRIDSDCTVVVSNIVAGVPRPVRLLAFQVSCRCDKKSIHVRLLH